MRASDNSPPARFVPFLVSVTVPEPKVSYGASGTYAATPGAETIGIAALHAALLHAASLSDLSTQEFPSRYPMVVNHHGTPYNPLRVSSG